MIAEQCLCKLGKNYVDKISALCDYSDVDHELMITDEFRRIVLFEENFPQDHYIDTTQCLIKIRTEGTYPEIEELNEFRKSLLAIKELRIFFNNPEIKGKYERAASAFSGLEAAPFVLDKIDHILSKEGLIRDSASPVLRDIRSAIKQKHAQVSRRMQTILKAAQKDGITEAEAEITFRDGRPVIPVSAGNKRAINGLIHDQSASGKTIFIEPGEVVSLNNEIRELEYAEKREIVRILIKFADDIRPYNDVLTGNLELMGRIDFLRAKAKVSIKLNCVKPVLEKESGFSWHSAVHPLLFLSHSGEGKEVVPLDISLDPKGRILIISGPNAGGKSVCLKTVGLVQYMLQCGLLVPMKENSTTCLFRNIFVEIGDEQSLENDLSTYSSHLLNMKRFLKHADHDTLVLIDEFGSGTEPVLGGAIAEAILEELNSRDAYGVITTHYANLKHFASDTPGILNGAMLFDTQKIKPLFRLSIGKPGSSFAIDIARNIGLPEEILKRASEKAGDLYINYEKHLREIIRDKKYWEDKRSRIRNVEKTLDGLYANYSSELENLQKERKKILAEAKAEAQALLKEANRNIERTIREIKESQAQKERTADVRKGLSDYQQSLGDDSQANDEIERKLSEVRKAGERLDRHRDKTEVKKPVVTEVPEQEDIQVNDLVKLPGFDTVGEVIEVNERSYLVAFGSMITSVDRVKGGLMKAGKGKKGKGRTVISDDIGRRRLEFKSQADVRGMRGDEAILKVQQLVDDASVIGVRSLKIIHGKGNGILRQVIRDYLKTVPFVGSFRDEHADSGGTGVTLVELDI